MARYDLTEAAQADIEEISRPVFFWPVMRAFAIVYRKSDPLVVIRVVRWRPITRSFPFEKA